MEDIKVLDNVGIDRVSKSIIMVLGVGGAGGNAVSQMYDLGIDGVTFMVANTDRQALNNSPVPIQVILGEGMGAGNDPQKGRDAAMESIDDIVLHLEQEQTKMLFITAGLGGGTGTGASPVIAKTAHDRGVLTVGIVTLPVESEGKKRSRQAYEGLEELKKYVDSLIVLHNGNIAKIYGRLPLEEAFRRANDYLAAAAKGIAELVTHHGTVNVDFADVTAVMRKGGNALMGSGRADGDGRIQKAADIALSSPLLNNQSIRGAKNILLTITSGSKPVTMDESNEILRIIQKRAGMDPKSENEANIIWGTGHDEDLGEAIEILIVATGFDDNAFQNRTESAAPAVQPSEPVAFNPFDVPDKFTDMSPLLDKPAYIRRKVDIWHGAVSNASSSAEKVVTHKLSDPAKSDPKNGTLF